MSDIRKGGDHLTWWIRPAIKKKLEAYFNNDKGFKCHRLTNVTNRASSRSSKYMGRSATFMKTKSRLSKLLDREATLTETFKYIHTLKANKKRFADEQSMTHHEDYTKRLEATNQQSQPPSGNNEVDSETSVVDPDRVWHEIAFEPHKNRCFGLGLFFISGLRSSALVASFAFASATSPANPQEVVDLREEELHQQVEQSEQRYNNLLARLREQIEAYNQQIRIGGSGVGGSSTTGSSSNAVGGVPTSAPTSPPQQGITMTTKTITGFYRG
ncbi:hypothetical protein Ahy_B01g056526 [Arachis hypogaea]|uniref:Uncharacterized protein n=1 Tax=Arachis hypogaea TaxID=3818 RepID=A0A445AYZ8_ARAHY|nr:hypothetical protein Ahy_B01g056526 [Arachis hypogaea]